MTRRCAYGDSWNLLALMAVLLAPLGPSSAADSAYPLWRAYDAQFKGAKYIDLTHAFAPGQPRGAGFGEMEVGPARAAEDMPGLIAKGEAFSYEKHGAGITAYQLPTDQIGTQLDPPAHLNRMGATISDLPATYALRPLVVINVVEKTARDPGYQAGVKDIADWETHYGRIPEGAVVMFRTDWSKKWADVQRFTQRPFPGVALEALQFLHLQRHILFHGHEPLDTDMTPNFAGESWILSHNFTQAEGVTNLDQVPEAGGLILIGFAKPKGGTGGLARYIAVAPANWPFGVTMAEAPGAPLPEQPHLLKRNAAGVLQP